MKVMHSEKDVKAAVRMTLQKYGEDLWLFMPPANGYGMPGIPDFIGSYKGHAFGVECKFGRGVQTEWQKKQQLAMGAAQTPYWVVWEKTIDAFAASFSGWAALCS